jgi:hypothetical protein
MAIDPRISLAVQAPDIMTALTGGLRAGEQIRNAGVRDQLLNQQAQVNQMNIANAQGAHMNKLAQALSSVPAQDRAAVLAQQMPYLEQLGIDPAQMLSGDLTDQGVQELFQATLPFAQMEQETAQRSQVGQVSPKDYTAQSIAEFQKSGDYGVLERYQPVTLRDINGVTYAVSGGKLYTPEYRPDGSVTTGALVDESEVTGGGAQQAIMGGDIIPQQLTPEAQLEQQKAAEVGKVTAVEEAKVKVRAEEQAQIKETALRDDYLKQGRAAIDALPNIDRMVDLNDKVMTGGITAAIKFGTDLLGTTPADIGEYNRRSSELVLSTIRQLGANPTEGERAFLDRIQPGVGQSNEVNSAILKDLKLIAKRQVERADMLIKNKGMTVDEAIRKQGAFKSDLRIDDGQGVQDFVNPDGSLDNESYINSLF